MRRIRRRVRRKSVYKPYWIKRGFYQSRYNFRLDCLEPQGHDNMYFQYYCPLIKWQSNVPLELCKLKSNFYIKQGQLDGYSSDLTTPLLLMEFTVLKVGNNNQLVRMKDQIYEVQVETDWRRDFCRLLRCIIFKPTYGDDVLDDDIHDYISDWHINTIRGK